MITNFEAWDGETQIYNGTNKQDMICELHDYIVFQGNIDETLISESEIRTLDQEAFERIGIRLFFAKW